MNPSLDAASCRRASPESSLWMLANPALFSASHESFRQRSGKKRQGKLILSNDYTYSVRIYFTTVRPLFYSSGFVRQTRIPFVRHSGPLHSCSRLFPHGFAVSPLPWPGLLSASPAWAGVWKMRFPFMAGDRMPGRSLRPRSSSFSSAALRFTPTRSGLT